MNRIIPHAPTRPHARAALALIFSLALLTTGLADTPSRRRAKAAPQGRVSESARARAAKSPAARRKSSSQVARKSPAAPRKSAPARKGAGSRGAELLQAPVQAQEIEADDAEKRENWFYAERAYPSGEIPADARRRAWESRPGREKGNVRTLSQGVWTSVGPSPTEGIAPNHWGPTSGRVNAIAVHPTNANIVLVGASTGGIWRSADGGATFAPVSDSQVDLAVGAIAFAPSNPNVVYAGMGDIDNSYVGTGILKSTDAGLTWTRINAATGDPNLLFPTQGFVTDLAVDPSNPSRVYVTVDLSLIPGGSATSGYAFNTGGIYVSADGGATWQRTLSTRARNLAIHPTNPQIIYAALRFVSGNVPGVYKSTDAGQNWTLVFASPFHNPAQPTTLYTRDIQVAVTPAAPESVYVYFGRTTRLPSQPTTDPLRELRLEVSDNGGQTWSSRGAASTVGIDDGQFGYNTYVEVSPADANVVYVGSRDVYKTTNVGSPSPAWTNITRNFMPGSTGALVYVPNGHPQFNPLGSSSHPDQQSFAFSSHNPNVIYIGNDGGVSKSADAGENFVSINNTLSLSQFVHLSIHPTDPNISVGGTQDNGTQRRVGGAAGWKEFSSGDGGDSVINPQNPSMVFTTYVSGRVSRFTNLTTTGATGTGVIADFDTFGEPASAPRVAFYPPVVGNGVDQRIYLGTWKLFVCSDCDDTAKTKTNGNPPNWTSPAPNTDLTKGLTQFGPDVLEAIAVAPSNTNVIYTGSRQGRAMASADGGANWTDVTFGLPNRTIKSITIDPANPAVAYLTVSGYGTGHVFRTSNGGASWADISGNLPNVPVNAFLIDPRSATTFYVGTDVGVFRSTNGGVSWETFNTGMPPVVVTAFAAQAGGRIQAATYGRGVYELSVVPDPFVGFSGPTSAVSESGGRAILAVLRTGSAVGAASVDYQTADTDTFTVGCADAAGAAGGAFARCDFATTTGTLHFAPGETSKSVSVPIVDDAHVEGPQTFELRLTNATGASLGSFGATTVTIVDNDSAGAQNPISSPLFGFFVRQQYIDFLSREPDDNGFNAWLGVLNNCQPSAFTGPEVQSGCDRIYVSGEGFFRSPEFALKGAYAFRLYKVAFNRLPEYTEIVSDMSFVAGSTSAEVYARRAELAARFALRPEFTNAYLALPNQQYVDALMNRYNLQQITTPDPSNPDTGGKVVLTRADLTNRLHGVGGLLSRAQVLRAVADSDEVGAAEFNNAFVAMQYYGYLRRKPEADGYQNWLRVIGQDPNNVRQMVNGFLNSPEYRLRFGSN